MPKGRLSGRERSLEKRVIFLCEGKCEVVFYGALISKCFAPIKLKMLTKSFSGASRFETKAINCVKDIIGDGHVKVMAFVCHDTDVSDSGNYPSVKFEEVIKRLNSLGPFCEAYDLPAKGCLENFFLEDEEALSKHLNKKIQVKNQCGGVKELQRIYRLCGKYYTKSDKDIESFLKHFNFGRFLERHFPSLLKLLCDFKNK